MKPHGSTGLERVNYDIHAYGYVFQPLKVILRPLKCIKIAVDFPRLVLLL
jgi:hypothetical protein